MAKIQGKLVNTEISLDNGSTWKTLICETSSGADFTRETTTAPVTKCDNETSPTEISLGAYSWTFPFDALVDDDPETSQMTYGDMLALLVNGTKVKLRRQYDNTGSSFFVSGDAYLTTLSEQSPAGEFVSFSGEFSGTGGVEITPES